MKEKIKSDSALNQTSEEMLKNVESEFSSPLINGDFEEDIHVLQCVNSRGTAAEYQNEQNMNGVSSAVSDDPNNPMPSLLSLPLSEMTTEPLNNGRPLSDGNRTQTQFVPRIGSDIPQSAALENPRSPASFHGTPSAENWEQRFRNTFAFHGNYGAHSGTDRPFVNISENLKAKLSENDKEPIRSRESQETSPGELIQDTAGEMNRTRKRRLEDEPRKSAIQRKMEHLDKEKERRLRQSKCYCILRDLVPSCEMKTDKANVLEETVAYLNYIKAILASRMVVIDKGFLEDLIREKESLK